MKRSCSGTSKATGEPCQLSPIKGGTVCHKHGGRAPQVRAAAERRVAEEQVLREMERAVTTYGLPREIDPGLAMLEEVHRTAGHVSWLAEQVGQLEPWQLTISTVGGSAPNPLVITYQRERAHLIKAASDAVRCGLEARQVALAERLGEQVLVAMRGFAAELGHDPDDPKVVEAGVRHLRLVAG
jgi:hypothetical protein